ncbi:MAG: sulfotransferase, partial [Lacipirellulaceae bacterium]
TKDSYQHSISKEMRQTTTDQYLEARIFSHSNCSRLRGALLKNRIYAETSNRLTYIAPELSSSLKNAKFIFLHRHPAEVVVSAMRRNYYASNPWDDFRITPREDDQFYADWPSFSQFQKCCWYWRGVNEFSLQFLENLPKTQYFTLSSNDLFAPNIQTLNSMFKWIGGDLPEEADIFELLSVKHNEQRTGAFPPWEEWEEKLKTELAEIAGPVADRLGYSL